MGLLASRVTDQYPSSNGAHRTNRRDRVTTGNRAPATNRVNAFTRRA